MIEARTFLSSWGTNASMYWCVSLFPSAGLPLIFSRNLLLLNGTRRIKMLLKSSCKHQLCKLSCKHTFSVQWQKAIDCLLLSRNRASSLVRIMFPGVAERVETSAAWHETNNGIKPLFGVFWNLCVNAMFPGQKRVHCFPHIDFKNIVGICLIAIYQTPGKLGI